MAVMNLKKQANKKNEGSLQYVKGGLSTFFEAQDALSGKCQMQYTENYTVLIAFIFALISRRICGWTWIRQI